MPVVGLVELSGGGATVGDALVAAKRAYFLGHDVRPMDAKTLAVTSLGRPAPRDAGRWLRVTDARERDGVVEALVVVDQLAAETIKTKAAAEMLKPPSPPPPPTLWA